MKFSGILTATAILLSAYNSVAKAETLSDVFAAPPQLKERWFKSGYNVRFVPKNGYTYIVEVAGKNRDNNWTCAQLSAVKVEDIEWNKVRAQLSVTSGNPNFSAYADGDVVSLMGRDVGREDTSVQNTMHFRVVAQAEGNRTVYKSNWQTANAANLTNWSGVSGCEWVAD